MSDDYEIGKMLRQDAERKAATAQTDSQIAEAVRAQARARSAGQAAPRRTDDNDIASVIKETGATAVPHVVLNPRQKETGFPFNLEAWDFVRISMGDTAHGKSLGLTDEQVTALQMGQQAGTMLGGVQTPSMAGKTVSEYAKMVGVATGIGAIPTGIKAIWDELTKEKAFKGLQIKEWPSGLVGVTGALPVTGGGYNSSVAGALFSGDFPNEIFGNFQFICLDTLTGNFFPSDEIRPINYDGGQPVRWLCYDKLTNKMYKATQIRKATIYV